MPRCSRPAAWALAAFTALGVDLAFSGHGQGQDFADRRADLPSSQEISRYWHDLTQLLQREQASLQSRLDEAGETERLAIEARTAFRRMAARCLTHGLQSESDASITLLTGWRLARVRGELDQALQAWTQNESGSPVDDSRRRLRQFVARLDDRMDQWLATGATNAAEHDRMLAATVAPLAAAVSALTGRKPVNCWAASARDDDEILHQLRASMGQLRWRPATREVAESIMDSLERGAALVEHRSLAMAYGRALEPAMEYATELQSATWLPPQNRAVREDRLEEAMLLFQDRGTRATATAMIERLGHSARLLSRMNQLVGLGVDVTPILPGALAADDAVHGSDGQGGLRYGLSVVLAIFERMVRLRELSPEDLPNEDQRRAARLLDRACRQVESAVLNRLSDLTSDDSPMADPSLVALLTDHAACVTDLETLPRIDQWRQAIQALRPASAEPFGAQAQKMVRGLLDPARRPDSRAAMRQFERQLAMFQLLPLEDELRREDSDLARSFGNRRLPLIARIDQARDGWCKAWGEGNSASAAGQSLLMLHRLLQAVADVDWLLRPDQSSFVLDRWAAWPLGAEEFAGARDQLRERLGRTSAAAAQGNAEALREDLGQLEHVAPMARLAGRLNRLLGPALQTAPGGLMGVMSQCIELPPREAPLLQHRLALARLCRSALELRDARPRDREGSTEPMIRALALQAQALLESIDPTPVSFPTILGYDGSDPSARAH